MKVEEYVNIVHNALCTELAMHSSVLDTVFDDQITKCFYLGYSVTEAVRYIKSQIFN